MRTITNGRRVPEIFAVLVCRLGCVLENLGRALYDSLKEKSDGDS